MAWRSWRVAIDSDSATAEGTDRRVDGDGDGAYACSLHRSKLLNVSGCKEISLSKQTSASIAPKEVLSSAKHHQAHTERSAELLPSAKSLPAVILLYAYLRPGKFKTSINSPADTKVMVGKS